MTTNRRTAQRYVIELPVELDGGSGVSRDLSLGGIRFETSRAFEVGSPISFSVSLDHGSAGEPIRLSCQGYVVRVNHESARMEVAATIDHLVFGTAG